MGKSDRLAQPMGKLDGLAQPMGELVDELADDGMAGAPPNL